MPEENNTAPVTEEVVPTPAPAPEPAVEEDDSGSNFRDVYHGLLEDAGLSAEEGEESKAPVETEEKAPDSVSTPVEDKPAVVPEPVTPLESVKPEVVTPPAPPEKPAEKAPEAPVEDWAVTRQKHVENLATNTFAITDADAAGIIEDTKTVVPRLMANMYVIAAENIIAAVTGGLPEAVERILTAREYTTNAEKYFWDQWKGQLSPAEHKDVVSKLAVLHRQHSPSASLEELTRSVGNHVLATLGRSPIPVAAAPAKVQEILSPAPPPPVAAPPSASSPAEPKANPWGTLGRDILFGDG